MILNLAYGEHPVLELRRHWFIFFTETAFLVIFICLPFLALFFLNQGDLGSTQELLATWFTFGTLAWFLFLWVTFFVIWTNFYLDAWIITNKRIINIEQRSLFNREVSEFRIDNIQDVTIDIAGFIPTILGYGDILIETAGEQKHCAIKNAPHPEKVKNIVSQLQADLVQNSPEYSNI